MKPALLSSGRASIIALNSGLTAKKESTFCCGVAKSLKMPMVLWVISMWDIPGIISSSMSIAWDSNTATRFDSAANSFVAVSSTASSTSACQFRKLPCSRMSLPSITSVSASKLNVSWNSRALLWVRFDISNTLKFFPAAAFPVLSSAPPISIATRSADSSLESWINQGCSSTR